MTERLAKRQTYSQSRFAGDTDAPTEKKQEMEGLVDSLAKTCARYKMEISA